MPDVIIIGGGIAGVSLCAALAGRMDVVLVEQEPQLGLHATGRSAAMYFESYGNSIVQALTRASRGFFTAPPTGFSQNPLVQRRECLWVKGEDEVDAELPPWLPPVHTEAAIARVPILRREWLAAAALDASGFDLDVDVLLNGFARAARGAGVRLLTGLGQVEIWRVAGGWSAVAGDIEVQAPRLVNAAGAWADQVAQRAGVEGVGLQPMRRSAMSLPAPEGLETRDWPMVIDAGERFYFKPDAGQLLLSPANEDPDLPADVAADEMDVAIAVDRFERATTYTVKRISHRWAGLRSFVTDRSPVVGYAQGAPGFFWLAGQGGYGIQTAPALSRVAAAVLMDEPIPEDIAAYGVDCSLLSPARFAAP